MSCMRRCTPPDAGQGIGGEAEGDAMSCMRRCTPPVHAGRGPFAGVVAMVLAYALLLHSVGAPGADLAEAWSGLLEGDFLPEVPEREAATLRSAWGAMLAGYPERAIEGGARTLEEAERIPAAYRRHHRFYDRGREDWMGRLAPYRLHIEDAARRFDVPAVVLGAVILQESGGDAGARATGTSAKGLMQTIDATFALAKQTLAKRNLHIADPLLARDSILAGAWYLSYCYDLAVRDERVQGRREHPQTWRSALEYYYAGPGWGRDPRPIIHVYRNGERTRIHKAKYSDGVLAYVRGLGGPG